MNHDLSLSHAIPRLRLWGECNRQADKAEYSDRFQNTVAREVLTPEAIEQADDTDNLLMALLSKREYLALESKYIFELPPSKALPFIRRRGESIGSRDDYNTIVQIATAKLHGAVQYRYQQEKKNVVSTTRRA